MDGEGATGFEADAGVVDYAVMNELVGLAVGDGGDGMVSHV